MKMKDQSAAEADASSLPARPPASRQRIVSYGRIHAKLTRARASKQQLISSDTQLDPKPSPHEKLLRPQSSGNSEITGMDVVPTDSAAGNISATTFVGEWDRAFSTASTIEAAPLPMPTSLPRGWEEVKDDIGRTYWWNTSTDKTTLTRPVELAAAPAGAVPSAFAEREAALKTPLSELEAAIRAVRDAQAPRLQAEGGAGDEAIVVELAAIEAKSLPPSDDEDALPAISGPTSGTADGPRQQDGTSAPGKGIAVEGGRDLPSLTMASPEETTLQPGEPSLFAKLLMAIMPRATACCA